MSGYMKGLMVHILFIKIEYGPHYTEGIGYSDGEVMERLWSYLRRYSRMTKEMRPSHRKDILAHALLQFTKNVEIM